MPLNLRRRPGGDLLDQQAVLLACSHLEANLARKFSGVRSSGLEIGLDIGGNSSRRHRSPDGDPTVGRRAWQRMGRCRASNRSSGMSWWRSRRR